MAISLNSNSNFGELIGNNIAGIRLYLERGVVDRKSLLSLDTKSALQLPKNRPYSFIITCKYECIKPFSPLG